MGILFFVFKLIIWHYYYHKVCINISICALPLQSIFSSMIWQRHTSPKLWTTNQMVPYFRSVYLLCKQTADSRHVQEQNGKGTFDSIYKSSITLTNAIMIYDVCCSNCVNGYIQSCHQNKVSLLWYRAETWGGNTCLDWLILLKLFWNLKKKKKITAG